MLPWIKLDILGVRTGRISVASLAAKGLWLEMLTIAAQAGDVVSVPADARWLARQAGADLATTKAAIAELVEVGSISEVDGQFVIHGAEEIQAEYIRKREGDRTRQNRKRQKDRGETAAVAPTQEPAELNAGTIRQRLWDALDGAIADEADPEAAVAIYELMYDDAAKAGEPGGKYADVKGVGAASLANLVVAHAAHRWLGTAADDIATQRRLAALRKNHGSAVLRALPVAATGAKGDPLAYLQGVLTKGGVR